MKNRYAIALILAAALTAAVLCGCGQTETAAPEVTVTPEAAEPAETSEAPEQETAAEPDTAAVEEVYQQFLAGQVPVYVDVLANTNDAVCQDYGTFAEQLTPGTAYTFDEFTAALVAAESAYYTDAGNLEPQSIEYALIDCGNDGVPELALRYNQMGAQDLDINLIFVFKQVEDKLQCVFVSQYGYRTDASLTSLGYFTTGGSGSAASWSSTTCYIDKDGTAQYDYGEEISTTVYSFYVPNNDDYIGVAEERGIANSIRITRYSFAPYSATDDYNAYLRSCMYTFVPIDTSFNPLTGDQLTAAYEQDSPYMAFCSSTGFIFYTPEETDAAIAEHEQQIGLTAEIKNAAEPDWTTVQ